MAEIHRLLEKQYERPPTEEEVADFVASADTNRDGVISLVEYVATVLKDRAFTVAVPCSPFAESLKIHCQLSASCAQGSLVAMIAEQFRDLVHEQGGCRISDTARRAITIEQLQRLL